MLPICGIWPVSMGSTRHSAKTAPHKPIFGILVFTTYHPSKSLNRAPFWALPSWLFHKGIPASFKPLWRKPYSYAIGPHTILHKNLRRVQYKIAACGWIMGSKIPFLQRDHRCTKLHSVCPLSPAGAPPVHRAGGNKHTHRKSQSAAPDAGYRCPPESSAARRQTA